jgi:hypothetical protein
MAQPGRAGNGAAAVNGFEIVALIIGAFFVFGVGVGILVMLALSAVRYRRALHSEEWHGRRNYPLGWPGPGGLNGPSGLGGYRDDPGADDGPGDGSGFGDAPPRWPAG